MHTRPQQHDVALFDLGRVISTGEVKAAIAAGLPAKEYLHRHITGDGGDISDDDKLANLRGMIDGARVHSVYDLNGIGRVLHIVTEPPLNEPGEDGWEGPTTTLRIGHEGVS